MEYSSDDQTLTLGLGLPSSPKSKPPCMAKQPPWDQAEPSLTLSLELSGETYAAAAMHQELSATSSHSNSNNHDLAAAPNFFVSVKRERDATSDEEEIDRSPTATAATTAATRKKLRLTKEQSALLEESFKQHSTLNPKQKQALAERLNLRARQVEVWFQNRRARTKLKQTELDCEELKKCCETLTEENRKLQKELHELRALKLGHEHPNGSFYMHVPPTLTMCPSCCQRAAAGVPVPIPIAAAAPPSNNPLSLITLGPGQASRTHYYSSFSNPSAAC